MTAPSPPHPIPGQPAGSPAVPPKVPAPPRVPVWRGIAAALRAEIAGGQYRPGDKLPTEAALAARFGVNRHTVRHALAALAEQGLVHARRGAGVFVTGRPADYPLGRRVRFHQNMLASGRTPSRRILRLETRAADRREAAALALEDGAPVHVLEGLSLADEVPVALFLSLFPAALLPGFCKAIRADGSVTAAFAADGIGDYTRASTRLTALAADTLMARHLHLSPGAPILRTQAINIDLQGRPIELGTTWFAGDRVTLTVAPD
jgi:GntR family transcriptional regulator, phosphonate transport system regulatory protein